MNTVNDTTTKDISMIQGIQCIITTIRLERSCDDLWMKNISLPFN